MRDIETSSTTPADDLADVWDALDSLPSARPPADLAATTVELVAANVANTSGPTAVPKHRSIDRMVPLLIILGGLAFGIIAGRATSPDPDARILEQLPVLEHLSLLQELGSVEFLASLADQMKEGQGNPPRWIRAARDPAELRAEAKEFDATLASLRSKLAGNESSRDAMARRRQHVDGLSASELATLEKSVSTFAGLAAVDRRELDRIAEALADPAQTALHEAARQWHVIVAAINPAFRRNIIEMAAAERLEWLARSAGRYEPRPPSRPREDDRGNDRRPSGPRRDGTEERTRPSGWTVPVQRPPPGGGPGRPVTGGPPPSGRPGGDRIGRPNGDQPTPPARFRGQKSSSEPVSDQEG